MHILKTRFGKLLNGMLASVVTLAMIFGSFVSITTAYAATCAKLESGTLIKVKGHTAVYLLSGKKSDAGYPYRKYFPNAEVYYSWFSDFSNVVEIDGACIDDYQSGGGINYRPGSYLVKTDVSPNVYAIATGNKKHLIPNEQVAVALYGASWAKKVRILPDVFDGNLAKAEPLPEDPTPHAGMILKVDGDKALYYATGNTYQEIEPEDVSALMPWASIVTRAVFNYNKLEFTQITKKQILKDPTQDGGLDLSILKPIEPVSDALTTPGGKRLTVPWAEGTFSLEIPYAAYRTLNYDVKVLEPDAFTPAGYNAYIQVSTEGTSYEDAGIEWYEPFIIQIIPRDWWEENTIPSAGGTVYEILSIEEDMPGKYVTPWFLHDDFVYVHIRNAQDCPGTYVGELLVDSPLCEIKSFETEIWKSFTFGE